MFLKLKAIAFVIELMEMMSMEDALHKANNLVLLCSFGPEIFEAPISKYSEIQNFTV